MFNSQSLTVENCIIKLILIKLFDGRTQTHDRRTHVIKDSINDILSIARHCQAKQVLVNIT